MCRSGPPARPAAPSAAPRAQSPFEGSAEAADLALADPDPVVSQFAVSYSMTLNLLRGRRRARLGMRAWFRYGPTISIPNP